MKTPQYNFSTSQTEYVVLDEHTLAAHIPNSHNLQILRRLQSRGAINSSNHVESIPTTKPIRRATTEDFTTYRVSAPPADDPYTLYDSSL